MYHSVTIGSKNSWDDWHLIPTSRPTITMPKVKSKWLSIPGTDGQVELMSKYFGVPLYENREGSLSFIISDYDGKTWSELYSEIASYLHGRPMTLVLEDDPDFYYEGFFEMDEFRPGSSYSAITISYRLRPFKQEIGEDFNNWKWDPFTYQYRQTTNWKQISVSSIGSAVINADKSVVPTFYSSDPIRITFNSKVYQVTSEPYRNPEIRFAIGSNELQFVGSGTIVIDYRGGSL